MDSAGLIRQLPVSIEAERALLGAIIIKPESFDIIGGMITADDFYLAEHQHIFLEQEENGSGIVEIRKTDIIIFVAFPSAAFSKASKLFNFIETIVYSSDITCLFFL